MLDLNIRNICVCEPDIHLAPTPYASLAVWRSLPWTARMQTDCFEFSEQYRCIILEYHDRRDSWRENQYGLLPLDYTRSVDVLYIGSKMRNLYSHELELWWETLIYLDTFANFMQNSEESDTMDRTETLMLQFFSRLVQKMNAEVDRNHSSKLPHVSRDHCSAIYFSINFVCLFAQSSHMPKIIFSFIISDTLGTVGLWSLWGKWSSKLEFVSVS